jgi:hypothetical protein
LSLARFPLLPFPYSTIAVPQYDVWPCDFAPRVGANADDAEEEGEDYGNDMEFDDPEDEDEVDEVAQARAAAKALGKSSSPAVGDISDGLAELNMDAYDEEEDGRCLRCCGRFAPNFIRSCVTDT